MYVYFSVLPMDASGEHLFIGPRLMLSTSGKANVDLKYVSAGNYQWGAWEGYGNTYTYSATEAVSIGVWYCVEVSHASGAVTVYVNGVQKAQKTGLTLGNIDRVEITTRDIGPYGSSTVYYDCCVIADAYIGPETTETSISVADSGVGAEAVGKLRNMAAISEAGTGSETLAKLRNLATITDAGLGSEILEKLRQLGIISDIAVGSETVSTPSRDLIVLDVGSGSEILSKFRQLGIVSDSGIGSEVLSKLRQLGIVSDAAAGSELIEKARLMSILDSALGSELVSKLRNVAIIIDSGLGSEVVTTPNRDIVVLDSGSGAEILAKLRQLGVITDSGAGTEGITQIVLVVGLGPYIIVMNERSGGISLSTSLPKNISLDISRPTIALRVNPDAN